MKEISKCNFVCNGNDIRYCSKQAVYKIKYLFLKPDVNYLCQEHKLDIDDGINKGIKEWKYKVMELGN